MFYQSDFGKQVEKKAWFALSDLILVFQFHHLVFGNKKKDFFSLEHRAVAESVRPCWSGRLARCSLLSYFPEDKGQV